MATFIGEIAQLVPTVHAQASNQQINNLFKQDNKCSGIVVVENGIPIGLVTRTDFYQNLGSLYGYNLYIDKTIEVLMNKDMLAVDYTTSIIDVSRMAMKRKEEELYDYVIITKYGLFVGVVSISRLLMTFAEVQAQMATYLNPLTGLPGNHSIEEQLNDTLNRSEFSVLYIDLDNFKAYNDIYGFAKGDQVLKATALLLQKMINRTSGFLGHIGGDDFLAVLQHHNYEGCCKSIIREFDCMLSSFYSAQHLSQKFVFTEDRMGIKRRIPLLSISIAIVTNQNRKFINAENIVEHATKIKKICKQTPASCFVDDLPSNKVN